MTTVRHNSINSSNFVNPTEPKVNKHYDDSPVENVAEALNQTTEQYVAAQNRSQISFEKPQQVLDFGGADGSTADQQTGSNSATDQSAQPELSAEEKRKARREEFHRARNAEARAMQLQKEMEGQRKQFDQFKQFMEMAKKDPTAVAKAFGMDPTEFLRQYQNAMFNIPNEPPKPTPEEDLKARIERYEEERKQEKQAMIQEREQMQRSNFIQFQILPVINGNTERFELLNLNGKEQCAEFIYDMMNSHWQQTGEVLKAEDVAEEMENQLAKEMEDKINSTKKLKKFNKHFRYDTDAPGEELTVPGQLGEEHVPASQQPQSFAEAVSGTGREVRKSAMLAQSASNERAKDDGGPNTLTDVRVSQGPAKTIQQGSGATDNNYQRQTYNISKKEQRIKKITDFANANKLPRGV